MDEAATVAMKKRFIIKITPQQALESPAAQQALVAGINFETSWGQLGVLMSVLSAGMTYVVDLLGGTQIKFSLGP